MHRSGAVPCTTSWPAWKSSGRIPTPPSTTTCWLGLGHPRTFGRYLPAPRRSCRPPAPGDHRPPPPRDPGSGTRGVWTGSTPNPQRTRPRVTLLAGPPRRAARRGGRGPGRGPDPGHRDGHLDVCPPLLKTGTLQAGRHPPSSRPAAPLAEISAPPRIGPYKPDRRLRLFGRVLERLEDADSGRVVWSGPARAPPDRHQHAPGWFGGHDSTCWPRPRRPKLGASCSREAGPETRTGVRTRPGGVDAHGPAPERSARGRSRLGSRCHGGPGP